MFDPKPLPDLVKQIIMRFAARFPMPVGEANLQPWIHKICQQLAWTFPDDHWTHKGDPHSKDAVAQYPHVWDIIVGAGTTEPRLDLNAMSKDMTGQVIETVTPYNWLGETPVPPDEPPVVTDPCPCVAKLDEILTELRAQRVAVEKAATDIRAEIAKGIKIRFS